jgi:hypothetical protein
LGLLKKKTTARRFDSVGGRSGGEHFWFGFVWFLSKKITKIKFLKSEKFKLEPVSVQFGFLNKKNLKTCFFFAFLGFLMGFLIDL